MGCLDVSYSSHCFRRRHQDAVVLGEHYAGTLAAQQAGVARLATKGDPAFDGNVGSSIFKGLFSDLWP